MPSEFSSQEHLVKGSEIFVGGLSRSVSERVIHELFSPYGEIIELRMIKDQNGNSKGFCFVRFASKDSALRAEKEKDGVMVLGKRIGVALSSDQDSLFFGNLHKDWSRQEFDTLVRQAFKDVVSVNLAMSSSTRDSQAGKRRLNRGFAFVQFSSHAVVQQSHLFVKVHLHVLFVPFVPKLEDLLVALLYRQFFVSLPVIQSAIPFLLSS